MTKKMIYLPEWVRVLVALHKFEGDSLSQINYYLQATYSWTHRIVTEFERLKWIKSEKEGRTKVITITPKGKKVLTHCIGLFNCVKPPKT